MKSDFDISVKKSVENGSHDAVFSPLNLRVQSPVKSCVTRDSLHNVHFDLG
jgi:hypothetical protein